MPNKIAWSLDSNGGDQHEALNELLHWLRDEAKDKKGDEAYSTAGWELRGPPVDLPRQTNGNDCGVFASMFIFYLAQGVIPKRSDFAQKNIKALRLAIAAMILRMSVEGDGEASVAAAAGGGGGGGGGPKGEKSRRGEASSRRSSATLSASGSAA